MTIVNIRRDVDDKFYRYRMPLLEIKIEGKGNGIKTVVPNMSDIARALREADIIDMLGAQKAAARLAAALAWDKQHH